MDEENGEGRTPEIAVSEVSASDLASALYDWAKASGSLADGSKFATSEANLTAVFGSGKEVSRAASRLKKLRVVAVGADDKAGHVAVMVKNQVTDVALRDLPVKAGEVTFEYVGSADVAPNYPQPPAPMSAVVGSSRFWTPSGRFSCGSSITVAPIQGAGTLGALIRLADGKLYGLTNNHVTGDCNHTEVGMHIMCPAGIDAEVNRKPPTAIGIHTRLTELKSGDPAQIGKQQLDAAIFEITDESLVTSWQGNMDYDTPTSVAAPSAQMKVKKVGRTSGTTFGKINAEITSPIAIPYKSSRNSSVSHYTGLWSVSTTSGEPFAEPGDSGALVVTEDGTAAVGLILGGHGAMTLFMPIEKVLAHFGGVLVGEHNH